jgi:hypothetical protein
LLAQVQWTMCALIVCSGIIGSFVAAGAEGGAPRSWSASAAGVAARRRPR